MTMDVVSMEHSKSFIFALQELKNLRPQLYSAAEYCEKSYLHSDKKQVVLDNLKDYAVRALINAVDHLGTVAYKLTDLLEQQTFDVSTMDLKVSTLNQKLLTCHVYTDREGLRQQQLLAFVPRHHKHYILPSTPISKTLSWHLASETKSTLKKTTSRTSKNPKDSKFSAKTSGVFHLLDSEERRWMKPSAAQLHLSNGTLTSRAATQTFGVTDEDVLKGSKPLTKFGSFDDRNGREAAQVHSRSKSVLSTLFIKQKAPKLKAGSVL
ncbi:Protein ABIL1 Abl interactor-like protein [Vigna angularis]|uniref:Protein ABIL1 Abl interactor-like protein n=1 Tax=Phaseolus angularis TaxID=3914 RepID=A0A8T0K7S4_PHAAN|nr:Protein ABIL1 Abl interactor-like protein [Vigna angularis]